uniref:hypothetical protein n=1 Tax=Saccharopolyspora galaxeae TaxID=2781241 RepID=UPI0035B0D098
MSEQPLSVAVIGAGMAGRSHAAGYRQVNTVFGAGLPPVRLAAIADADPDLAADAPAATATSGRSPAGRRSPRTRRSTRSASSSATTCTGRSPKS